MPPQIKGTSFSSTAVIDKPVSMTIYDKDTYQGVPVSYFRLTTMNVDFTDGTGNYAPVGFAIKISCKTPISIYTGFDMWLEFIDRPINQDYSIYNSLTYSIPMYQASMM